MKCQENIYKNGISEDNNNYHPLFTIFQMLKISISAVILKIHNHTVLNQKSKELSC